MQHHNKRPLSNLVCTMYQKNFKRKFEEVKWGGLLNAFGNIRGITWERINSNFKTVCIKYVICLVLNLLGHMFVCKGKGTSK